MVVFPILIMVYLRFAQTIVSDFGACLLAAGISARPGWTRTKRLSSRSNPRATYKNTSLS